MPTVSRPEFTWILDFFPFRFFQFFCLISFDTTLSKKCSSLSILTWHIFIAAILLLHIVYTFYVLLPSISNNQLNLYVLIHSLELLVVLLAYATCIIESLTKRTNQIHILTNVQCIASNFSKKLQYIVSLTPVYRRFIQSCLITFLISGASCVWSFSLLAMSFSSMLGLTTYSFQLMYVRKIQVGFYVDMIVVLMEELRNVLDDIRNEVDSKRRLQKLMIVQRIYREIVKTVSLVNCTFGLSLVALIFQNVLQLLSSTYWFIIFFYYTKSISGIISE